VAAVARLSSKRANTRRAAFRVLNRRFARSIRATSYNNRKSAPIEYSIGALLCVKEPQSSLFSSYNFTYMQVI
jgi:hypothetical protein